MMTGHTPVSAKTKETHAGLVDLIVARDPRNPIKLIRDITGFLQSQKGEPTQIS